MRQLVLLGLLCQLMLWLHERGLRLVMHLLLLLPLHKRKDVCLLPQHLLLLLLLLLLLKKKLLLLLLLLLL